MQSGFYCRAVTEKCQVFSELLLNSPNTNVQNTTAKHKYAEHQRKSCTLLLCLLRARKQRNTTLESVSASVIAPYLSFIDHPVFIIIQQLEGVAATASHAETLLKCYLLKVSPHILM